MKKVLILFLTIILALTFITPAFAGKHKQKPTPTQTIQPTPTPTQPQIGSNLYCNSDYCNITVTYAGGDAAYNNEFGYVLNNKYISLGYGHKVTAGTNFIINGFTKGQEIIFYIKNSYNTFTSGYGIQTKIFKGRNFYKLSFEDVPLDKSDRDYDDIMLKVSGTVGINQEYLNPTIVATKVLNTDHDYDITVTIPQYTNAGEQKIIITPLCSSTVLREITFKIPNDYITKNKGLSYTSKVYTYKFRTTINGDKIMSIFTNSTYLNATGYAETFFIVIDVQ